MYAGVLNTFGYNANSEYTQATSATLGYMYAITGNTVGDVYLAEGGVGVNRIRRVNSAGFISTIAGSICYCILCIYLYFCVLNQMKLLRFCILCYSNL